MIYKMYNSSTPVEEKINNILTNAGDAQFVKYLPKEPEPEITKTFTNQELTNLIIECADVQSNGNHETIAYAYGVEVVFVKMIEAAILAEWNRRQAEI